MISVCIAALNQCENCHSDICKFMDQIPTNNNSLHFHEVLEIKSGKELYLIYICIEVLVPYLINCYYSFILMFKNKNVTVTRILFDKFLLYRH